MARHLGMAEPLHLREMALGTEWRMKRRKTRLEAGRTDAIQKARQAAEGEGMAPVWHPVPPLPPSKAGGGISVPGGGCEILV